MRSSILAFVAIVAMTIASSTASADVLVEVDLSVANQVTINATTGLSEATVSGADITGIYLENLYSGAGDGLNETLVSGDFTNAENPSDGSPSLFRGDGGADPGLNIFSWSSDTTVSFTAGSLAFVGSATFDLEAVDYADMLAGSGAGGDIYFAADTEDDIPGATVIGQYSVITAVPEPGSLALLGTFGLACLVRRRRS